MGKISKFNTFEELKNARSKAYKGMEEGDVLGFLDQHTGFYPDPAHFIYELLQNAEDMMATKVTFKLFRDKLVFEHDGKKRDFDLDDIDAITNKGKSPKADDPTQIGKFGMGFKAVYVYTNTPEIHSGKYDFRIENVIVPNDVGVPKIAKERCTQFIFPFDNPSKPAQEAIREIVEEGFEKLNETALLFLLHIKKITYYLPDNSEGFIAIEKSNRIFFLYEITVKKAKAGKAITYWARFSDECPVMVEDKAVGKKIVKRFPVSIAYRLVRDGNKYVIDSELEGKVCLFFPTQMKSLLHFHINAPFASTVARDIILSSGEDGEANEKLMNKLAELTAESLHCFKKAKMLDYAAYSALPTLRDYFNVYDSPYKIFALRVKKEFENFDLFITDNGEYRRIHSVYKAATKDIKTILPVGYIEELYHKSWIPIVQAVTRTEYFMNQFEIRAYNIEDFIDSLEKNPNYFDKLFAVQNEQYFKTLYLLLSQAKERPKYPWMQKKTRNEILKGVAFLLCDDGKLHKPNDGIYLKTNYQPKYYLKNPIYVEISLKNTIQDKSIREFLLSLGVREMCEREDLFADIDGDNISTDGMILKMMEIADGYRSGSINIFDLADSPIFIARNRDGNMCKAKASDCCWDDCAAFFFGNTDYVLALEEYEKAGEDISKDNLKEIFEKLHGKLYPRIVISNDLRYPFPLSGKIDRTGERYDTRLEQTYTIDQFDWNKLKKIKENDLIDEAAMLWELILKCNQEDCLYTKYQANNSRRLQKLESTLVYYLKRTAWVPTRSGEYKFPYELKEEDLLDGFKYDKPSVLLEAISVKPNDLVEQLKNSGIKDENLNKFAGFDSDVQEKALAIAVQIQEQKRKAGKSLSEMAATSDREQLPEEDDDDGYGVLRGPKNLDKRKIKLEKEFDDREQPTTTIKKLRFVLEKPNNEEKEFVRNEYKAHCQICGNEGILTKEGERYFEAINIFNTRELMESQQIKMDLGWNTLSLCPNCAAKFKYSQRIISNLFQEAETKDTNTAESFDIPIQLENKPAKITFSQKHLLALQVAIRKLKAMETEDGQ